MSAWVAVLAGVAVACAVWAIASAVADVIDDFIRRGK